MVSLSGQVRDFQAGAVEIHYLLLSQTMNCQLEVQGYFTFMPPLQVGILMIIVLTPSNYLHFPHIVPSITTTPQATPTLSSDESTSTETDTARIKDDAISTVAAQISAQKNTSQIIIGVTIVVILLIVTGLVVAIIVAVIFKKRGKSGYSLPDKKPKSNRTAEIVPNGVGK